MLEVYVAEETKRGERTVYENQHWLVVVPYWATWPYQVMLLPKFTTKKMSDFSPEQRESFARALIALTVKYDNLFKCNFPYRYCTNEEDAFYCYKHQALRITH